ncbi:hypothetical protein K438DRAFT_1748647 [Mycena galopus ATCC 62051]|nr:hypothetical protein K438DRAFT_1748647 [Mycena galopus ATCC 62051]
MSKAKDLAAVQPHHNPTRTAVASYSSERYRCYSLISPSSLFDLIIELPVEIGRIAKGLLRTRHSGSLSKRKATINMAFPPVEKLSNNLHPAGVDGVLIFSALLEGSVETGMAQREEQCPQFQQILRSQRSAIGMKLRLALKMSSVKLPFEERSEGQQKAGEPSGRRSPNSMRNFVRKQILRIYALPIWENSISGLA